MTGSNADPNTKWFINVAGAGGVDDIRGPLTSAVIVKALVAGTFKVSMRVSPDRKNWRAICNWDDHFEKVITKMIEEMNSSLQELQNQGNAQAPKKTFDEESGIYHETNISNNISRQLDHAKRLTEITVESNALRKVLVSIAMLRKTVVVVQQKQADGLHADDMSEYIIADEIAKKWNWKDHPRLIVWLAVAVGLFIAQAGYWLYQSRETLKKMALDERIKKEMIYNQTIGNYDKALELFSSIQDKNSLDVKSLLQMAEAAVHEKKYSDGRDLCQRILKISAIPADRAKAYAFLGLMDMRGGDLEGAAQEFRNSMNESPNLYSSLHNMGILYLQEKSFEVSETLLLKALGVGEKKEGATILALFEVALAMEDPSNPDFKGTVNPQFDRLKRVDQLLAEYNRGNDDYRAEILLARSKVARILGDSGASDSYTKQILSVNPTTVPQKDLRVDLNYDRAAWENIYNWCLDSYSKNKAAGLQNALIAYCLTQTGGAAKALPFAQFALQKVPSDPAFKGLVAFLMFQTGNTAGAENLLKSEKAEMLSALSLWTLARLAESKGDEKAAEDYWTKLLKLDANDASAIAGVASAEFKRGHVEVASKLVKSALARNPASLDIKRVEAQLETSHK